MMQDWADYLDTLREPEKGTHGKEAEERKESGRKPRRPLIEC